METADERLAWGVFFATIPAAIAGALGEETIERHLGQPWQIAIFLAVFARPAVDRGPAAAAARARGARHRDGVRDRRLADPRPDARRSRSGITITTGRFSGLDRDSAARFSFLLLVPVVVGAVLYKGVKHVLLESLPAGSTGPFVVGTLAAAARRVVAIDLLLGYVRRHDYTPFVIYRLVLAAAIVIVIVSGARSATF